MTHTPAAAEHCICDEPRTQPITVCPVHPHAWKRGKAVGREVTEEEYRAIRERQAAASPPNAPAAEREGEEPVWWVDDEIFGLLGDAGVATYAGIDSRGPYRTGWTKAELRLATALLAARRENETLRDAADARFAIYGRLLRGVQRTINGDDVQDHQLRAAIRALIGKMADEFAAMQPWDPDAPKIVQSAALAATPGDTTATQEEK